MISVFYLLVSTVCQAPVTTDKAPSSPAPAFQMQRNLMLEMLERSKRHEPRLPLPKPSAKDLERSKTGSLGLVNNGLMRRYYLPEEWSGAAFPARSGQVDQASYRIKTELFWIISRLNQCAYCLGHQEAKLANAGLSEAEIASLDGDWADAPTASRVARQLAVWKTQTPEKPVPAEIWQQFGQLFDVDQQGEILLAIANYNAMNRWTGPLNIPQEKHREYRSELSQDLQTKPSKLRNSQTLGWVNRSLPEFPKWLELIDRSQREQRFAFESPDVGTTEPIHIRLLKSQGITGQARLGSWQLALSKTMPTEAFPLPAKLRGEILWVCARYDIAPHTAKQAMQILKEIGLEERDLLELENLSETSKTDEPTRQALLLAKRITTNPAWVTGNQIEEVRKHWGDRATAQIIELSGIAAAINRLSP